jgi:hypothetical protein
LLAVVFGLDAADGFVGFGAVGFYHVRERETLGEQDWAEPVRVPVFEVYGGGGDYVLELMLVYLQVEGLDL